MAAITVGILRAGTKRNSVANEDGSLASEGTNKSQRCLVAATLEESCWGLKEIGEILEGGYALGQQHENRNGGRC